MTNGEKLKSDFPYIEIKGQDEVFTAIQIDTTGTGTPIIVYTEWWNAEHIEPRKRTMQLVIDNKKQKEFAHEITKKFSFEELALFMYENSCEYCQKQHNCMGNVTPQDCAKNIRQKFEKAYFEMGDKE